MGLDGLEPSTSRLSGVRSNQLSYRPAFALFLVPSKLNKEWIRPGLIPRLSVSIIGVVWQCHLPGLHRKEVIQPHLPIRLPCYDFTPIIGPTFDGWLLAVTPPASGVADFRGVTGGVYKARERIHRSLLICDY